MKWSIQELFRMYTTYNDHRLLYKIVYFPKRTWKRIKGTFHWLFKGYCKESLWNADETILTEVIERLKQFRKLDKVGYPWAFESEEAWQLELDKMIDLLEKMRDEYYMQQEYNVEYDSEKGYDSITKKGMEQIREYAKQQKTNDEEALKMFSKYLSALWD